MNFSIEEIEFADEGELLAMQNTARLALENDPHNEDLDYQLEVITYHLTHYTQRSPWAGGTL